MTPTPLTWSVRTTLSILAPPTLTTPMVYVNWLPDETGLGLAVRLTVSGLEGSAAAMGTPVVPLSIRAADARSAKAFRAAARRTFVAKINVLLGNNSGVPGPEQRARS